MPDQSEKTKEEIILSRRMFLAGCFGLPWLWICNSLYFRLKVFGPMIFVDYWPGKSPPTQSDEGNDEQEETMEQQLERQMEKQELEKWVKRSTRGAAIVMTAFVAWIVTFQVNREHFGEKWFVMDPTDAEVSGW